MRKRRKIDTDLECGVVTAVCILDIDHAKRRCKRTGGFCNVDMD